MSKEDMVRILMKLTYANRKDVRFDNLFEEVDHKLKSVPMFSEDGVNIYLDPDRKGIAKFYAIDRDEPDKVYLIHNVTIFTLEGPLYTLTETVYSALLARMLEMDRNVEVYVRIIHDFVTRCFGDEEKASESLMTEFRVADSTRSQIMEKLEDADVIETILHEDEEYTAYLLKIGKRNIGSIPLPSSYLILIEPHVLVEERLLYAYAVKLIERNLKTS